MKPISFIYLTGCLLITACDAGNKQTSKTNGSGGSSPVSCYRYTNANDTITLKLVYIGESITGTLVYKLQSEKRMGTIQGMMRDNVLLADYTIMTSDSTTVVKQVAFKKTDNSFVEGNGPVSEENARTFFKDPASLQFNNNIKLQEINCQ